jgi:hypothetical protein
MISKPITSSYVVAEVRGDYNNRVGLTDPGNGIRNAATVMNQWDTEEFSKYLRDKDPELFDQNGKVSKTLDELVFGGSAPRSELYEGLLNFQRGTNKALNNYGLPIAEFIIDTGIDPSTGTTPGRRALNAGMLINENTEYPSFAWLIGAPLLFLRCLKQDSVIVMPLMKNGRPIVSGLSYSDPTMIWNSVRGELRQLIDDTLDGTRDMVSEYATIGSHIWNNFGETLSALADQEAHVANLPLRGETQ